MAEMINSESYDTLRKSPKRADSDKILGRASDEIEGSERKLRNIGPSASSVSFANTLKK